MRDGFKRRAALWLAALFLIAGLLGGNADMASAAAWSGGTADPVLNDGGWYDINTPEQLAGLAKWVNEGTNPAATYKLTADIDLGGTEWTPIGTSTNAFKGVFDGQDKTISGLKISGTSNNVGLFGYISGTNSVEVKKLTILAPNVSSTANNVGALAGGVAGTELKTYNSGPQILEIGIEGGLVKGVGSVGGLIGSLANGLTIKACYTATSVVGGGGSQGNIGGMVGSVGNVATFESCYSVSSVNASDISSLGFVGGLIGNASVTTGDSISLTASYATGSVNSTSSYTGGLAGSYSDGYVGKFQNSYAAGSVASSNSTGLGGFVGRRMSMIYTSAYDPQGTGQNKAIGLTNGGGGDPTPRYTLSTAWQDGSSLGGTTVFGQYYVGKTGYYPQLKVFEESTLPNVKAWSALSVVQLVTNGSTENAGESVMALTTPFALPTKDAAGTDLQWRIVSGGAVLAVDGDNNLYVSPDKTGEAITLTASNGDDRWRTFALKTDDSTLTPLTDVTLRAVTTDITFGGIDPTEFKASKSQTITVDYEDDRNDKTGIIYVEITKPDKSVDESTELKNGATSFAYDFSEVGFYTIRLKIKDANDNDIYVLDSYTIDVSQGGNEPSDIEIDKIEPEEPKTSSSAQTLTLFYTDNTDGLDEIKLYAVIAKNNGTAWDPIEMTLVKDSDPAQATFLAKFEEEGDYKIRVQVKIGDVTDYADGTIEFTVTKGDDPDPNPNDVKVTGISPTNPSASDEKQTFTVSYNDTSGVDDIKLTAVVTMLPNGEPQTFNMEKNQTVNNMGTATFEGIFDEPGTYSIQVWVEKGNEKYTAGDPVTITVEEPAPDSDVTITGIKPESLKASSTEATITVEFDDESGKDIKLFAEVTVNGTPWPDLLPLEMNDDGESATFTEIFNTPGVYTIRIKVQVGDDELYYANSYKTLTITKGDDPTPDPDPVDDPIKPHDDGSVDSTVIVRDSDGNQLDITKLAETTSNEEALKKLRGIGLDYEIVDGKLRIFGDATDIDTVTLEVLVTKADGTTGSTTVTVTVNPVEHDDAETNQAINNVAGDWTGSLTTETDSNGRRIYYFTIYVPRDLTDGNAMKVLEVGADGEACTITDENYVRDNARSASRTSDTNSTNNARAESTLNPRVEVKGWTRTYDDAEIVDVWYRIGVHKHKRTTNVKLAETSIEDNGGWRSTGSGCDAGFGFAALAIGVAAVTLGSKRRKK